jgi:pre-mRNA-processing factor SLU7
LIPHEVDEDGNAINPHIPQFMAAAPWYLKQDGPGLKHQKAPVKEAESGQWYKRGTTGTRATKFRKGACENCGAMTHKKKDCMERPRKVGAAKSQKDIAPDEYIQPDLKLGFESKRDRYNGFDTNDYAKVVERYEAADALKQKLAKQKELERAFKRAQKAEGEGSEDDDSSDDDSSSDEDDDAKVGDKGAMGFDNVKRAVRAPGGGASGTVRNLRLREDTAKYLLNLDVDSAYYDPKTRSMRENPTPNADPKGNFFKGDNAARHDGAVVEFERMNRHAWEQAEAGTSGIHMQGAPSQAEALYKQFKEKKEKLAGQNKQNIMEKYGDASAGKALPDGLALGQTEQYVEYDRAGRLIKGTERQTARSIYDEDVYNQNHTSVWGSFWQAGQWGYACCKSMVKNSYCTGAQGIEAAQDSAALMANNIENKRAAEEAEEKRKKSQLDATTKPKDFWGSEVKDDVELDPKKLLEALKRQDEREEELKREGEKGGKKRGYNVEHDEVVTAEDMEAYRMKKRAFEDPMNKASGAGTDGYDMV